MSYSVTRARRESDPEAGYVLLGTIFLSIILLVSLAIAAPKMAMEIQRDKDLETIHRGEQYKRAIQLYYRQFGRYPTSIDQLVNSNQIRFLRKRYADPITGKDDWKPVIYGQAHVRPLGFFGQPLVAVTGNGMISSFMYAASPSTTDANGVPVAPNDARGDGPGANSGFGNGTAFGGTAPGSTLGGSGTGSGASEPNASGAPFGSSDATTMGGGGPIVGLTLPVDKPSLILYKRQTRYNKWEFNYDPAADLPRGGFIPASTPGPAPGTPTNGAPGFTPAGAGSGTAPSTPLGNAGSPQPQ